MTEWVDGVIDWWMNGWICNRWNDEWMDGSVRDFIFLAKACEC